MDTRGFFLNSTPLALLSLFSYLSHSYLLTSQSYHKDILSQRHPKAITKTYLFLTCILTGILTCTCVLWVFRVSLQSQSGLLGVRIQEYSCIEHFN